MGRLVRFALAAIFIAPAAVSAQPVVPGAAGFGMDTRAAYGAGIPPTIFKVTNLQDSGRESLREALEANVPRVVLFEISGTIALQSALVIASPYVTVAGQTAPSPGILIRNYGIIVNTHDVLLQHLRIRHGGETCGNALEAWGAAPYNLVYDHLSVSWGQDETVVLYNPARPINATVWRSVIAEGLDGAMNGRCGGSPDGTFQSHGMLVYSGTQNVFVGQTLFAHNVQRNPYSQGDTRLVLVNNLIFDWAGEEGFLWANFDTNGGSTGGAWFASAVGNRFVPGPQSSYAFGYSDNAGTGGGANRIYRKDNTSSSTLAMELNDLPYNPNIGSAPGQAPVPVGFTPLASRDVEALVLGKSGARPVDRDAVDMRIVREVQARTARFISSQDDVGGWPDLGVIGRRLTVPANPHHVSGSGYTVLEDWLHQMAATVEGEASAQMLTQPAMLTSVRVLP